MKLHYYKFKNGQANFGDNLNTWLWDKAGLRFTNDDNTIFVGIGTLINEYLPKTEKTIIFSSGVGYGTNRMDTDSTWEIACVRGPLSAERLGLSNDYAVTDGAALIQRFVAPANSKNTQLSYMPHIENDSEHWRIACEEASIGYISPSWDTQSVIAAINQSEKLITEAMHGAIVADALRVPWYPVVTTNKILRFKWDDWCRSLDIPYCPTKISALWVNASRNVLPAIRQHIKIRLVARDLKNIGKKSHFILSHHELLECRIRQLEERLQVIKKKYFDR